MQVVNGLAPLEWTRITTRNYDQRCGAITNIYSQEVTMSTLNIEGPYTHLRA
jgi:hypothetical protein